MDSFDLGQDYGQHELRKRVEKLEEQVAQLIATPKAGAKKGMAESWTPREQDYEWAKEKQINVDVDRETDRFRDYWISKGERRVNWFASWRNWLRRAEDTAPPVNRGQSTGATRSGGRTAMVNQTNRDRADRALDQLSKIRSGQVVITKQE